MGKIEEVRNLLKEEGVAGLLVTQTHHFAWLTGGRSFVPLNTENGVSQLWIDESQACIVTTSIEHPRMMEEECGGWKVVSADWRQLPASLAKVVEDLAAGRPFEKDTGRLGARLDALQVRLGDEDLARIRSLGADCGRAIASVARALTPGQTEYSCAGQLGQALMELGIDPVVLLVAFDDRISLYRHPLPTMKKLERTAMLVLCGRRYGLIASATRLVSFGDVSEDLRRRHDAVMRVDAAAILNTRPGATAGELYDMFAAAYAAEGFTTEIEMHHQGGLTGYKSRYWKAAPGLSNCVEAGSCYAWNPSIAGTKSEDTIYLPADGANPELLTESPGWPMVNVTLPDGRSFRRPDILVREPPTSLKRGNEEQ